MRVPRTAYTRYEPSLSLLMEPSRPTYSGPKAGIWRCLQMTSRYWRDEAWERPTMVPSQGCITTSKGVCRAGRKGRRKVKSPSGTFAKNEWWK